MNLNNIPVDDLVVIDANIILYAVQQLSSQCKRLLYRCADNDVKGILPTHILAEIMHQLMIAEARDNGWIQGTNPAKQLSKNPDIVKKLFRYEEVLRDISNRQFPSFTRLNSYCLFNTGDINFAVAF